jgi:hypothetical protein
MRTSTRRIAAAAIGSLATVGLMAAPAVADPGTEEIEIRSFTHPDPCHPDQNEEVTLVFTYSWHAHQNMTLRTVTTLSTSTNGYVGAGHETSVFGPKVVKQGALFMNVNEAGDRYRVNQRIITTPNGVAVDSLEVVCVRST